MENEIWRDVKGFEGLYQVSNLGRVKSLPKKVRNCNGYFITKERILKPQKNSKGYLRVQIVKSYFFVHRMVATAFIPNAENKPCVNHKDCNPLNNNADNLEWCTHLENIRYSADLGRFAKVGEWGQKIRRATQKYDKKVIGTNIQTGEKVVFNSIHEADRNGFNKSGVCEACSGKRKYHKGYYWSYAD